MTEIHVLNGDALAQKFPPLNGEIVICREALIEGPVHAPDFEDFFLDRAAFISSTFHASAEEYFDHVKREFDRLSEVANNAVVNLWFEHDLFCQVNLWFTLSFLERTSKPSQLFVVMPSTRQSNLWSGFGNLDENQLTSLYQNRIELTRGDRELVQSLWQAFQKHDLAKMATLSENGSAAFPLLRDVTQAHLDRYPKEGVRKKELGVRRKSFNRSLIRVSQTLPRFLRSFGKPREFTALATCK
jgi:hypothetical protein